jgi:TolA-binding protein
MYALESKHPQAAAAYSLVLQNFPKSPEVPEAIWLLGQAYMDLKFCKDAKAMFQELTKRYPRSSRVNEAKERLRDLQKMARDKKACIG